MKRHRTKAAVNHASHTILTGSTRKRRTCRSGAMAAAARKSVDSISPTYVMGNIKIREKQIVNNTEIKIYNVVPNEPHADSMPSIMK